MKPRGQAAKSDSSSSRPGTKARAGESRFFSDLGVQVVGSSPGYGAPAEALKGLLRAYLGALKMGKASLTLRLVGAARCRALNKGFRGVDRVTDVLSFPASEGKLKAGFDGYLGDLALCPAYAWSKRGRFDPDFGAEAAFLVLHGLLHLGGHHHDTPAQERALWRLSARLSPHGLPWRSALRRLGPLKRRPLS